jgi:hypothetical protein
MRIDNLARFIVLSLAIATPTLVRAQFQQPTDEELKMTADPKAPGASAVYLYISDVFDDTRHVRTYYARIKVLQEKGKELATVEIPYDPHPFKVEAVQARTIHADGTVIPLTVKPEDLLYEKNESGQIKRKVFNLPSVEVGSILEYYFQIHYEGNPDVFYYILPPHWEIQKPYYVHKAHYVFIPIKDFMDGTRGAPGSVSSNWSLNWWEKLPPGVKLKTEVNFRYSLDVTDVPPIPQEEWMPPIQSVLYQLNFYYLAAYNGTDYWISNAKRWSKEVDRFAEPAGFIKAAVAGLIAPADSDLDKAKKLYNAVQALDNTSFSRTKSESELKQLKLKETKRAEDTWNQKSGSRNDIALLYLAMLRAAGLTAYDAKVVDRSRGIFNLNELNFDQLDDDIVILSVDGKEILLDPGEKMCPFETVHWKHSGAGGVRQTAKEPTPYASALQTYNSNILKRVGDVAPDGRGGIAGNFHFLMTGQEAIRWRQAALRNDEDEVKKQFDNWLESMVPEGAEAHIDRFTGLDDPSVNLVAVVHVQGAPGAATAKRLLLPSFFFATRGSHPFVDQEKRQELVDMHYAEMVTDQIVYHLPAGFSVEGAPQDAKVPWKDNAVLIVKTKPEPNQITIVRQLARAFTILGPEEYQDLRDFYKKVAVSDQQQLVLTRAPATSKEN